MSREDYYQALYQLIEEYHRATREYSEAVEALRKSDAGADFQHALMFAHDAKLACETAHRWLIEFRLARGVLSRQEIS